MNELKKIQSIDIEKKLILALNETLDTLERSKMDIIDRKISCGRAKKVANMYIPIMLRNNNRIREFRLFMKKHDIETCNVDLSERVERAISFFC